MKDIHPEVIKVVEEAADIALKHFDDKDFSFEQKDEEGRGLSVVTQVDKELNDLLVGRLREILPGSGIVAEESAQMDIQEYNWSIDPIDGTGNYQKGADQWGISVGLWKGSEPVYGILYFPRSLDKYYYAIIGEGVYDQDDQKVSLKPSSSYKPSFSWDTPNKSIKPLVINEDFGFRVSYRMYGAATYSGYCLARGSHDFYIAYEMSIWDLGAIIPIAQELGLTIDYLGKPISFESEEVDKYKFQVLIAKPDIYSQVKPHVENIISKYEASKKSN